MNSVKVSIIRRNIIKCRNCGDIIESKSTHDFLTCKCGKCSVDGGLEYLRRSGDNFEDLSLIEKVDVEPKYQIGEMVSFKYLGETKIGQVKVINYEFNIPFPFYEIMALGENRLYKNIIESAISYALHRK